jgi:hypothetical protein
MKIHISNATNRDATVVATSTPAKEKTIASKAGKPVKFIDLANFAPADPTKLFWTCDGHWSVYGNKWAAEIIGPYLQ